jgi:hypothetical protein
MSAHDRLKVSKINDLLVFDLVMAGHTRKNKDCFPEGLVRGWK